MGVATVRFGAVDQARPSDAAIVLGAAVRGSAPSPVFAARIDHGIDLYRRGVVQRLIVTGGVGDGAAVAESAAARAYAVRAGVPAADILTEDRSRTTLQNLTEARAIMAAEGLRTALIVSDPLHLRRALIQAGDLGIDARASPAPGTRYRTWRTKLPFLVREIGFTHHYLLLEE